MGALCSFVTLPDLPGIGLEGTADLYREMQKLLLTRQSNS